MLLTFFSLLSTNLIAENNSVNLTGIVTRVEVLTKKALDKKGYLWKSDGQTGFSITESDKKECGTKITLYLNENGDEYTNRWSIDSIIKKYSDHIAFPIELHYTEEKDKKVTLKYVDIHIDIGIEAMTKIGDEGEKIKHFKY